MDPDQTAPIGAVCSGSLLFASILNWSVMLGNYLQQTTSADDIFRCIFFLGTLRVQKQIPFLECSWNHEYFSSLENCTLTVQETQSTCIHDSMNRSNIEFIAYIYSLL